MEAIVELATIDETRQRIVAGLMQQAHRQFALLADIAEGSDHTDHNAILMANWRQRSVDRDSGVVAAHERGVAHRLACVAIGKQARDRGRDRFVLLLIDQLEDVVQRLAQRAIVRPTRDLGKPARLRYLMRPRASVEITPS